MKTEIIIGHEVDYEFFNDEDREMDEVDIEHVSKLLAAGYTQGELKQYDSEEDKEYSGWWDKAN
ncbi:MULTISPECIES: hypothetical protein [Paenibacillus]|uniref:hypothetical protein n=1 Tax=Paenibacillus TaxID=44249 RepID=UPI00058A2FA0|nr:MULTISPECIES: hypothetical protein [Paenibacillus]AJE50317.1 hypothetical protein RE92_04250 [Paenibacillus polymyxa]MBU9706832.1 hypothetical protein [Paenibacillus sp. AK121]MEE4567117.1 hypothetical protein [Paenibacillus polymyxa]QOH61301.1 hypothetical protein DI243_07705 [Paenibacillus polymyxa]